MMSSGPIWLSLFRHHHPPPPLKFGEQCDQMLEQNMAQFFPKVAWFFPKVAPEKKPHFYLKCPIFKNSNPISICPTFRKRVCCPKPFKSSPIWSHWTCECKRMRLRLLYHQKISFVPPFETRIRSWHFSSKNGFIQSSPSSSSYARSFFRLDVNIWLNLVRLLVNR